MSARARFDIDTTGRVTLRRGDTVRTFSLRGEYVWEGENQVCERLYHTGSALVVRERGAQATHRLRSGAALLDAIRREWSRRTREERLECPRQRGPGRPRLDPGGETVQLTLRVTRAQADKLDAIVESGLARDVASAARWAIDQAPHQG